jgi:homoserine kinase
LAAGLEGHPDNVAPALLGGLVASIALDGRVEAVRLDPPAGLEIVAWIPDRRLPTADMRAILPSSIPRADAVANLARVAVAIAGLAEGRADAMRLLGGDRLHEPYRSVPYPELPILVDAALAAGATSACLAGSGSTIVAFVAGPDDEVAARVEAGMCEAAGETGLRGRSARLHPRSSGARGLP